MLAADLGQTVVIRVFRMGTPEIDMFGRDCSPAFYIGRAVATPQYSVTWEMSTARMAVARRASALCPQHRS